MKRDYELTRKIVLAIEESESGWAPKLEFEGYTDAQVGYHCYLLLDAGLAEGRMSTTMSSSPKAALTYLTNAGHEFAEGARNETLWKKAMGTVQEKGGSISISVLTELLAAYMRSSFGLS